MSIIWPATLPSLDVIGQLSLAEADNVIRSSVDVGPAKLRRRTTVAPRPLTMAHPAMTSAQAATFRAFYRDTLSGGALAFMMADPTPGASGDATFRFRAPPTLRPVATDLWSVSCQLEVLA